MSVTPKQMSMTPNPGQKLAPSTTKAKLMASAIFMARPTKKTKVPRTFHSYRHRSKRADWRSMESNTRALRCAAPAPFCALHLASPNVGFGSFADFANRASLSPPYQHERINNVYDTV